MNTLFLDLEWGQVYGSYKGHFIPTEVGCIFTKQGSYDLEFISKKFYHNVDLVIRRNKIDEVARTIGFTERVVNLSKNEYHGIYNPNFKLDRTAKTAARRVSEFAIRRLGNYLSSILKQYDVHQLVLFGSSGDLVLLQQANVELTKLRLIDVQRHIQGITGHVFSLDKISFVIGFQTNTKWFGTKRFKHIIPTEHQYRIKPHRAIGDACRMLSAYEELSYNSEDLVIKCRNYLSAHKARNKKLKVALNKTSVQD